VCVCVCVCVCVLMQHNVNSLRGILSYDPELFVTGASTSGTTTTTTEQQQQPQPALVALKAPALKALERFTHIPAMDRKTFADCLDLAMMNAGYAPLAAVV